MRLLIADAVILGGTAALVGTGFREDPACFSIQEFLSTQYRKQCWIHDGIVRSVERAAEPLVFILQSPNDPDLVLEVESQGNPPENLRVGRRVICKGLYREGKFRAAELITIGPVCTYPWGRKTSLAGA